jgi:hypothetical protein
MARSGESGCCLQRKRCRGSGCCLQKERKQPALLQLAVVEGMLAVEGEGTLGIEGDCGVEGMLVTWYAEGRPTA